MTNPTFLPANTNASGHGAPVQEFRFPVSLIGVGTEVDLGADLPDEGIILKAALNVVTAEATGAVKTIDIGILSTETGGDADGFEAAQDVSTAGLFILTGGALGPADHVLDGVAKSPSATTTGGATDFAELVAYLHVWVLIPTEVI